MQAGGFRAEFVSALLQKYECPLCKRVLRDPLQTTCGHRFCESCLDPVLRQTNPICPFDGEPLVPTEIFRDICCEREILNLKCYCTFKKYGCNWSGDLRSLEKHAVDCPHKEVLCSNTGCTVRLAKMTLEEHSTNECPYKKEPCPHCKEPIAKTEQEAHFQTCPKILVECPSGCGTTDIPRDSLEEHQTNQCALAEVLCTFHNVGCTFKGLRDEEKEHEKEHKDEHLHMMSRKVVEDINKTCAVTRTVKTLSEEKAVLQMQVSTQNETLATTVQNLRAMQARLSKVEKAVAEQRQELAQARRKLETAGDGNTSREHLAAQLEEYGTALQRHESKMGAIERELARAALQNPAINTRTLGVGGTLFSCERRLERNDHQLTLHGAQLSDHDLQLKLLQATSYDGTYIWKIDQWQQRMQDAVNGKTLSVYCPGFYVGRFGYRLCARLYPNGDGMGRGTHLSLFFVVMRGEYDALLQWPFKQRVNFRLMDQSGDQHVEDAFRPDPCSVSFKRPTTNMNIASGCPLFISHSTLRTRGYVKDDVIFIRIDIDKSGLPPVCL